MDQGRERSLFILLCILVQLLYPAPSFARERGADGKFEDRQSAHFILYQDVDINQHSGLYGSDRFEREVLGVLEEAYDLVLKDLDWKPLRRVTVVIYDDQVFEDKFAGLFRFSAAGFYEGVIRVRGRTRVDERLTRVLHHEYLHAALDAEAGGKYIPGWLNEGLAEFFEREAVGIETLHPGERAALQQVVNNASWIPLRELSSPGFSRLSAEEAGLAYLEAYAMIRHVVDHYGKRKLSAVLRDFLRSGDLDRALQRNLSRNLDELEAALVAELS
jgi:hypothetical protein